MSRRRVRRPHLNSTRGSFLVMTVMLLAILSLLVIGVSHRGQLELRLASYDIARARVRLAATAGLERVLELLAQDTDAADALNEPWASNASALSRQPVMPEQTLFTVAYTATEAGQNRTVYGAQDENARLNLNAASVETIAALPGMDLDVARSIAAFRTDAATTDPVLSQHIHSDQSYYQSLIPPYTTKGKPFESLAEAALVRGMTPERFAVVSQCCTVYATGVTAVNINTAVPEVVRALRVVHPQHGVTGLSEAFVNALLVYRAGADGMPGTADDGVFQQADDLLQLAHNPQWPGAVLQDDTEILGFLIGGQQLGVASSAVRIRAEGRTSDGTIATVLEAVVLRGSTGAAPRVTAWRWE